MTKREDLKVGTRVQLDGDVIGTVMHVYSATWANMTDQDVSVGWDGAGRTNERAEDLEVVATS